ncbi:MAG: efflux RND transporter permease subunit [Spirochaetia bacterium]
MSIVRTVIQRPISVVILCFTLMLIASVVIPMIPQDLTPDIEFPFISVITNYDGANPSEIESSVTKILEPSLINIEGLKKMSSVSRENMSQVMLQFDWGVDLETATNNVRDQIDRVRSILPDDAESPAIFKLDLNASIPVSSWSFSGNGLDSDELYDIADRDVKPYLEQVAGVSEAGLSGGRERQVRVELIQNRLEAYSVSITDIRNKLLTENVQLSAGSITEGVRELSLRVDGKFKSLEQIQDLVIKTMNVEGISSPVSVRLRDLGSVFIGYEDPTIVTYVDGEKSLSIDIYKQSGSNTVQVAAGVEKQVERLYRQLPSGLVFERIFDSSNSVKSAIGQVVQSIFIGGFLTVLTLLFFLRNIKSALIVAITMPLSILTTVMMMYFFGLSLNILSLAGLNLGIGMIVDSSIVLLENTTRYREKGVMARSSAILGCEEMVGAIISGSLTTICVFLPLVLFASELGIIGVLVNDMSFTIVISLATSLLFAVITVPILAGVLLPIRTTTQRPLKGLMKILDEKISVWLNILDEKYANGIEWALTHKKTIISSVAISLFMSLLILAKFVGFELMPPGNEPEVQVSYKFPPGTRLDINLATMNDAANKIKELGGKGIYHTMVNAGGAGFGQTNDAKGEMYIIAPEEYKKRVLSNRQIMDLTRSVLANIPGLDYNFASRGPGGGGGAEVTIKVSSNEQSMLEKTADEIVKSLQEVNVLTEVQTNIEASLPEIEIVIDRDKASNYGLSFNELASEVRNNFEGGLSGTFEYKGNDIDIWTILREEDRSSFMDIDRIFVMNREGSMVSLANFATFQKGQSFSEIRRENQRRQIEVSAYAVTNAKGNRIPASVANNAAFKKISESIVLPEGVSIQTGGDFEDLQELIPKVGMVFFLAVFLVYAVMASQFENLKDPFIIITSVLTIPIGPSLLYLFTGSAMSAYSMIGFIVLAGIVVNHGIVLIDYTNLLRKRGAPLREAVILAGRQRLRPILMTTLTTVLGMIPMALAEGDGTTMSQPIGRTVFAGMISASMLTLLFTPLLYYVFNKKNEEKKIKREAAKRAKLEQDLEYARQQLK